MSNEKVLIFKGSEESLQEDKIGKVLKRAMEISSPGMVVFGMSRLVKGQVSYTLVTEEEAKIRRDRLHDACRNSLGGIFNKGTV